MSDTREASSAFFNNDKFVEVVRALDAWDRPTFTAQEIARAVGINHDLAKKVLNRLEAGHVIKRLPRIGGSRGALPYEIQLDLTWRALVGFVAAID